MASSGSMDGLRGARRLNRQLLMLGGYVALVAVLLFATGHSLVGLTWMYTVDHYQPLLKAGVIDEAALARYEQGRFAKDWMDVPEYLVKRPLGYIALYVNVATAAVLVAAAVLLVLAFRYKAIAELRRIQGQPITGPGVGHDTHHPSTTE